MEAAQVSPGNFAGGRKWGTSYAILHIYYRGPAKTGYQSHSLHPATSSSKVFSWPLCPVLKQPRKSLIWSSTALSFSPNRSHSRTSCSRVLVPDSTIAMTGGSGTSRKQPESNHSLQGSGLLPYLSFPTSISTSCVRLSILLRWTMASGSSFHSAEPRINSFECEESSTSRRLRS